MYHEEKYLKQLHLVEERVKPPIPNMGKNERANNIGVLKRIDPPHNDKKNAVKTTTDGIDIIIVVS